MSMVAGRGGRRGNLCRFDTGPPVAGVGRRPSKSSERLGASAVRSCGAESGVSHPMTKRGGCPGKISGECCER